MLAVTLPTLSVNKLDDHLVVWLTAPSRWTKRSPTRNWTASTTPTLYTEDDVVEVFIRANSGGTKLGKSDLLFSLLAFHRWEVCR